MKAAEASKTWGIQLLKTGISGLDEVFDGGIPKGRSLLVTDLPPIVVPGFMLLWQ